ncbi:MAG TPA: hypothetical protein VI732_06760 [Alphaproteobacteria bacterium]|nr:hypothetical protein [Alphaproteobacteria bacterium]
MTKMFMGLIFVAAIFAATSSVASAADYPPCKSRSEDRCMQMPMGAMQGMPSSKKSGMQQMKSGGSMMKGEGSMSETGGMTPASESGIPHGCSPATTPCQ